MAAPASAWLRRISAGVGRLLLFLYPTITVPLPALFLGKRIGAAGPATTIFFGWIGLDEHMTLLQIAGVVLVLGGVMLVTIRPKT